MFVVLAEATITAKPGEGSLDNPPSREYLKVLKRRVAFDNLQDSVQRLMNPINQLTAVAAVGPNPFQSRATGFRKLVEYQASAITVLNVGRMDDNFEQVADGVDQDVAFASADLLAGIIAAFTARLSRLHTLAVQNGCRWFRLASLTASFLLTQRFIDPRPRAVQAPLPIMVVDGTGWRILARQVLPLTTRARQVEHGINHRMHVNGQRSAAAVALQRQKRPDKTPLCVGHITGIGGSSL